MSYDYMMYIRKQLESMSAKKPIRQYESKRYYIWVYITPEYLDKLIKEKKVEESKYAYETVNKKTFLDLDLTKIILFERVGNAYTAGSDSGVYYPWLKYKKIVQAKEYKINEWQNRYLLLPHNCWPTKKLNLTDNISMEYAEYEEKSNKYKLIK